MHPGAKKHAANSEEENFFNMTKNMCFKITKTKTKTDTHRHDGWCGGME